MGESKRYYWIKLKTDFFNEDAIDFLLSQKNGCEYVVLYQMLCLKCANTNGQLLSSIGEIIIPYNVEKIARDTRYFDVDTVTVALELYKKLGLIYTAENGALSIADYDDMIGSETSSAKNVREWRKKKALQSKLQCNDIVTQEIEYRDKSIENRNKEIKKEIHNAQSDTIACEPVITITLNDKSEFPIYQHMIDEWIELYPNVDIMQELRNMKGWCKANPERRKTKKGIMRFIVGWLSREQDKPKYNKPDKDLPAWYAQTEDESVKEVSDEGIKRMQEALAKKMEG